MLPVSIYICSPVIFFTTSFDFPKGGLVVVSVSVMICYKKTFIDLQKKLIKGIFFVEIFFPSDNKENYAHFNYALHQNNDLYEN